MFANLLVILIVLGMGYWWGMVQGLFSSFLNFISITVAGCLALAFWEPLAIGVFMGIQPLFAWGFGLLLPFALSLLVIRAIFDTTIPGNVHYHPLVNLIGGIIFGLISGMTLSGILIIGISFMPLTSVGGYNAYLIDDEGSVNRYDRLWIPVDRFAAGYFSTLSKRSFSVGESSLHYLVPDLAKSAALYHLKVDEQSSGAAADDLVSFTDVPALHNVPVKGLVYETAVQLYTEDDIKNKNKLFVVPTNMKQHDSAKDKDGLVRITPSQVRLLGKYSGSDTTEELYNIGWTTKSRKGKLKLNYNKQSNLQISLAEAQNQINWVFLLPNKFTPQYFIWRNIRYELDRKFNENSLAIANMIGDATAVQLADNKPILGRFANITTTDYMPLAISRSFASNLDFQDGKVFKGRGRIEQGNNIVTGKTRVDRIYVPDHQFPIRVEMTLEELYRVFGRSRSSSVRNNNITLYNEKQEPMECLGYVFATEGNTQIINMRRSDILNGNHLPFKDLKVKDRLHIYYAVPKTNTAMWFQIGPHAQMLRIAKGKDLTAENKGYVQFNRMGKLEAKRHEYLPGIVPTQIAINKAEFKGASESYGIFKVNNSIGKKQLVYVNTPEFGPRLWAQTPKNVVQVEMTGIQVFAFLGKDLISGRLKGEILIEDLEGTVFRPFGVLKEDGIGVTLSVRHTNKYQVFDLPIAALADTNTLTLFFDVPTDKSPKSLIYRENERKDRVYPFQ